VYIGQWKNAVKHGNGKYMLSDGSVYEGEWKDGSFYDGNIFDKDRNITGKFVKGREKGK